MKYLNNKYLLWGGLTLVLIFAIYEIRLVYTHGSLSQQQSELQAEIQILKSKISRLESNTQRNFVSNQSIDLPVVFCGDTLDMANPLIRERVEREFYSLLGDQGQLQLYLKRTERFLPMLEKHLFEAGLPDDLKYLSVHESALLPNIRSRSNAVGLWQFMYHTGRLYRLKINSYVDERRDPVRATEAAMWFLSDLYKQFNKWPLVLGAYNGGQGRMQRSIEKQNSNRLIDLSLPEETERYYFKIVATKIILSDPEKFGFKMERADFFPARNTIEIDYIVEENRQTLEEIARRFGITIVELKDYNPHLINSFLPRGTYEIRVTDDQYNQFMANYPLDESEPGTGKNLVPVSDDLSDYRRESGAK
ncbi:MAG: hypothetical protein E4H13_01955 [Calditrichales bacterium]|nr:MAG: hypothetical protein E4H13_01955 [Calditrichales bacterium]